MPWKERWVMNPITGEEELERYWEDDRPMPPGAPFTEAPQSGTGTFPYSQDVPGPPSGAGIFGPSQMNQPSPWESLGLGGSTSPSQGGGGGGGGLLPGFTDLGRQQAWQAAYLAEHGGQPPADWPQAAMERLAGESWAAQHGSPASWGNRPGDTRVPLDVWKMISTASRSPDYGPLGPRAWAKAADLLGGGALAMRGIKYHPTQEVAAVGLTPEQQARRRKFLDILLGGLSGIGQ